MSALDVAGVVAGFLDSLVNLGGVIGTNIVNKQSVDSTNATNLQIARETNQAQIDLSNTAVQRRAADLEAAGFNRLLAATGEGASSPSLASPSMQAFQAQAGQSDFGSVFTHALEIAEYKRQVQLQEQQISNMKKEAKLLEAQERKISWEAKEAERSYAFNLADQDDYAEFLQDKRNREIEAMNLTNEGLNQENRIREPEAANFGDLGYASPKSQVGQVIHDIGGYISNGVDNIRNSNYVKKLNKEAYLKDKAAWDLAEKKLVQENKRHGYKYKARKYMSYKEWLNMKENE